MIKILAIESSCDETAAAVIADGRKVLSNVIYSQIDLHTEYGGVVPELASRKHIEKIGYIVDEALSQAKMDLKDIDAIAVTYGPGLVGSLLVGVSYAKALSLAIGKPLIAVNHILAHICANYLSYPELEPPFLSLIVSGGHTNLIAVEDYTSYQLLAATRDDAAGEAFDKIARSIGLGYPGGPKMDKLAREGNKRAIEFPRAKVTGSAYDFSFSGLKSSVLNYLNNASMKNIEINHADLAASFQYAVVSVLVDNTIKAAKDNGFHEVVIAGGVSANTSLREQMQESCNENNLKLYIPEMKYCTDNAAMVGSMAYYQFLNKDFANSHLNAVPNLEL